MDWSESRTEKIMDIDGEMIEVYKDIDCDFLVNDDGSIKLLVSLKLVGISFERLYE